MNSPLAVTVRAAPSLAVIKYWGKKPASVQAPNRAATSSIALGLDGLYSETRVTLLPASAARDCVYLDGRETDAARYASFFDAVRKELKVTHFFFCESYNNFPGAAGLASSSSGFAALAAACARASCLSLGKPEPDIGRISSLARIGSASAARAVYPGWVLLPAGARQARPLYAADFWPDLCVLVARISDEAKAVSSREAMEHTRLTSPYYAAWVKDSRTLCAQALEALDARDLPRLGSLMRASTYRMFGSMLASDPAVLYWKPLTLALITQIEILRKQGFALYETMDAGPQVKMLVLERDVPAVTDALLKALPELESRLLVLKVGGGLTYL
jgi:diphosphomevalonate decarboxylase